eukprot:1918877-Pyramimonas_sp.AAC.1
MRALSTLPPVTVQAPGVSSANFQHDAIGEATNFWTRLNEPFPDKRTAHGWALPCPVLIRATLGHSVPIVDIERTHASHDYPSMSQKQC